MCPATQGTQTPRSLVFHIVNRGIVNQTLLHDRQDCVGFLSALQRYVRRNEAAIYHWCLMPDHYHVVIELPAPETLSKVVGGWQQFYAVKYHQRHDTAGRLFQSRFKSETIQRDAYLLGCGKYVERNPVRKGLCPVAWEWEWSSARYYVTGAEDGLTTGNPCWAGKPSELYRSWLGAEAPEGELFRSDREVIGTVDFLRRVEKRRGRPTGRRRGPLPQTKPKISG